MVRIRLSRAGRRNAPSYRIVVTDKRAKRDGKFIELIGHYNPVEDAKNVVIKQDRYDHWVSVGAQPSDAIVKLLAGSYEFKAYNPNAKEETVEEEAETTEEKAEEPKEEVAAE